MSEIEHLLLDSPVPAYLLPHLQQPITIEALISATCPPLTAELVKETVQVLYNARLITVNPQFKKRNLSAFWDRNNVPGPCRAVFVFATAPEFSRQIETLLMANGVAVSSEADFAVIASGDYLSIPAKSVEAFLDKTVLLTKPAGNEMWIGPLLSPRSICWDCLRYWLSLRRWPEVVVTGSLATFTDTSIAWLPSTLTMATGLIATAATLLSAARSIEADARIRIFDTGTLNESISTILGRRNCRRCVPETSPVPPEFLGFLADNRTGILANTRTTETAVGSVFLAHSSVLLPLPRAGVRNAVPPLSAGGKGNTAQQAISRCLMEGIERYSCVFVGDEALTYARSDEINGISASKVLLFGDEQFAAREAWNRRPGSMHGVPEAFDAGCRIGWVAAENLVTGARRYIPAGCAYLWYPFSGEPMYNFADTNGCAAGFTQADATLRALLETIERDAVAIWWYNRVPRPGVDLAGWDDPEIQANVRLFEAHNRTLYLLDITHDLGISVYAAVSTDANGGDIYYGCAADACAAACAKRAIAELIQFWFWDQQTGPPEDRELWLTKSSQGEHAHLYPHGLAMPPQYAEVATDESLSLCTIGLQRAGLEAFAVDLTRPEIGVPVIRALVPGLQHFGPRFGGKRLYEVPVKMGWQELPLRPDQMNSDVVVF